MGGVFERLARCLVKTVYVRRRVRAICGAPVAPGAVSSASLQQRIRALGEEA
jgi:hypothetical protein